MRECQYRIIFDEKYEEVFAGNATYQQQCRDNLAGAKTFVPKLIETQELHKVRVSGGDGTRIG